MPSVVFDAHTVGIGCENQVCIFIYITAFIDRDYELLFMLMFIPVFSDSISLWITPDLM